MECVGRIATPKSQGNGTESVPAPAFNGRPFNQLLGALPADVLNRLIPDLRLVARSAGDVLVESDEPVRTIFFPNGAVVSLSNITQEGTSAELTLVGAEGMVGIAAFMGGSSLSRAVVQSPGTVYRIPARSLMREFDRHGEFLELTLRYMQSVIVQTAQTAVCNRHHAIDQQLCRWLLMFLDRVPSNRLTLTHELIARMLGVRREGVSEAASQLQRRGIIDYKRGHITINSRAALEERSCECYAAQTQECARLMAGRIHRAENGSIPDALRIRS